MELDVATAEESDFEYLPFSRTAISFDYPSTSSTGSSISRLNVANLQGPANLTSVLTGDEIAVSVQSWYANNGDNTSLTDLEDIVAAMLSGLLTQGAGIVDETTLINYAGAGGTGSAPLSNFLDPLVDAADMSLPQGFLIYVFFDEFLNINSQYSGMIQVGEPGALEILQSQTISIPANGYFYTYLTNYSDNLVSFDNLTIRRKNGVVRSVKEYYPYGLEYGRFNGSFAYNAVDMYNKGYTSATWHELEWKYEGLDLNYFAARYYDPIIGRWHAPDPLEQCHSPYASMVNDPANYIDPDGRLATPLITLASSGSFYLSTANSLVSTGMSIMGGVMSFASTISAGVAGFSAIKNIGDFIHISLGFALRDGSFGEISQSIYSNTTSLVTGTSPIENDDAIMDDKFDKSENEEFALVMHRSEEILELSTGMQIVYSLSFSMVVGGEEIGLETRMLMYGDKAANLKGDNSLKKPEYDLSFEQMDSHAGEKNWENTIYIDHDAFIHPGANTIHFEGCYGITKSDLILNDVLSNEKEQEYQMNFKSSVDALSEVREMYDQVLKEARKAGQSEIKFTLRTNSTAVRNRKSIQPKNAKLKI